MKIIHCSDLHLDSKMESNLDSKKAKERRDEILLTYQGMVKYAAEQGVKAIIIAGDMFDKKNVTVKAKNIVLDSINSNPEIDFVYLKGNHDETFFISDLEKIPSNLKLFTNENWTTYNYNSVTISGIEFGKKSDYEIYNSLMLNKSDINIVVLHGQEALYDNKDKAEVINLKELKNKNIDYLALGHIHTFKQGELDNRGVYCYSGCLEGRGFDECGEKGFVLLDINEKTQKIKSSFVPYANRCLHEVDVDISNTLPTTQVEKEIDKQTKKIDKKDLVKIVLTGKVDLSSERDIGYLEKKYGELFYFAKVYDKTSLAVDYMTYEHDASLKGEFIRLVLKQDLTDEDKRRIITTGIKALSGEEVN